MTQLLISLSFNDNLIRMYIFGKLARVKSIKVFLVCVNMGLPDFLKMNWFSMKMGKYNFLAKLPFVPLDLKTLFLLIFFEQTIFSFSTYYYIKNKIQTAECQNGNVSFRF